MNHHTGLRATALVLGLVLSAGLLGGCGGSGRSGVLGAAAGLGGTSAERDQLIHQLTAQITSLPADLSACVVDQARGLPIGQLRSLARSGANLTPAAKPLGARLLTTCIEQGKGVTTLRSLIAQQVAVAMPSTLPASFRACVEQKAGALSATQLAQLISTAVRSGQSAANAQGQAFGRTLGIKCLGQPGVLASLRSLFVTPFRKLIQSGRYSQAFSQCLLHKAEQISSARLEQFALDPARAATAGHALGESYAHECIAQGAKP